MIISLIFTVLYFFSYSHAVCPNGWISGPSSKSCYLFVSNATSWINGEHDCLLRGGHLVSIHDAFTNKFLQQKANQIFGGNPNMGFWMGLTVMYKQNVWLWSDNSKSDYINWDDSQPNTNTGVQCAYQYYVDVGKWASDSCVNPEQPVQYVCEIPQTPPPCPAMPSIQGSGLVGAEWKYDETTKKCYLFVATATPGLPTFGNTRKICQKYGATDLVSIGSDQENKVIGEYVVPFSIAAGWRNNDAAMLGLSNSGTGWTWVNGQAVTYSNWNTNNPNGVGWGQLMFGYLDGYKSKWNVGGKFDRGCSIFICEKAI